jgi:hypothetical protein
MKVQANPAVLQLQALYNMKRSGKPGSVSTSGVIQYEEVRQTRQCFNFRGLYNMKMPGKHLEGDQCYYLDTHQQKLRTSPKDFNEDRK